MPRTLLAFAIAAISLIGAGCSSGPQPPQPGTPGFYWASAQSTYKTGDFLKTNDNLSQLSGSAEYGVRAQPWIIVMNAGLAKGYIDLAENFEYGARANRANPTPFLRQVQGLHRAASSCAMQCAETFHKLMAATPTDTVAFEFPFPIGNATAPVQLQRVARGMMAPDAEIEDMQRMMLQRGVLLTVTQMVGAAGDPAKALEIFKSGTVQVPRATFLAATAKSLFEMTDLYIAKNLDQPDRLNVLCDEATAALKAVPATPETKELLTKIAAKARKPGKKT